jgi:hypothetical protein
MPEISLSKLAIALGLLTGLPQIYGLVNPSGFAAAARKFPRSVPWGVALTLLGTAWFVWNLDNETISDFAAFKIHLEVGFAAVGICTCIFVQDFLAVRGLAVVLLLLAKLMVDTGRPSLGTTPWVLVFQAWAYVLVIAGIWLTISPYRLRDFLAWCTADVKRIRLGCGVRLAFALLIVVLGFTRF